MPVAAAAAATVLLLLLQKKKIHKNFEQLELTRWSQWSEWFREQWTDKNHLELSFRRKKSRGDDKRRREEKKNENRVRDDRRWLATGYVHSCCPNVQANALKLQKEKKIKRKFRHFSFLLSFRLFFSISFEEPAETINIMDSTMVCIHYTRIIFGAAREQKWNETKKKKHFQNKGSGVHSIRRVCALICRCFDAVRL